MSEIVIPAGYTRGPWQWLAHVRGEVHLASVDRGQVYVMGFARNGMQGAVPTFQKHRANCNGDCRGCGIMCKSVEFGEPDHNGRYSINHPDAVLIAMAPKLAEAYAVVLAQRDEAVRMLIDADGYLSLVGHRYCHTDIPDDLREELLNTSAKCRRLYESVEREIKDEPLS